MCAVPVYCTKHSQYNGGPCGFESPPEKDGDRKKKRCYLKHLAKYSRESSSPDSTLFDYINPDTEWPFIQISFAVFI
jgi:hypothetical protein